MRYLLVDGHSVIFAWPELRKLHARHGLLAREELTRRLTAYQDATGIPTVVVFDGTGPKANEQSTPGGIQIFYSAEGQTADSIIERLTAKYARQHEITVATSDHLEQQTASSFGAMTMTAEALREFLEEASADLARRLKRHSGERRPAHRSERRK